MAGSLSSAAPSSFEPLHVNRLVTGLWTNTSPMRDAATSADREKYYGGRQDRLSGGVNTEISAHLTLRRRPGVSVFNSKVFPPIKRFYPWNTFTLTSEFVRVMADTANTVYDATGPNTQTAVFQKSAAAQGQPTFFLGVGNVLYFTNGVDNKQLDNVTGKVSNWGSAAPVNAPKTSTLPRPNPYGAWQPDMAYAAFSAVRSGLVIVDNSQAPVQTYAAIPLTGGGNVLIGCGQNAATGSQLPLPSGYTPSRCMTWTTPGVGAPYNDQIGGAYQSTAAGGILSSAFQALGGGLSASASSNWIFAAWDAAGAGNVTVATAGGFTTLTFTTASGADLAIVTGAGADGTSIPLPSGFSTSQMLSICGMSGTTPGHGLWGVAKCDLNLLAIEAEYNDNDRNLYSGSANVFAVFYKLGQGTSIQAVNNGTALLVPTPGGNVAMTFAPNIASGGSFGLPTGFSSTNTLTTAAMGGSAPTFSSWVAHLWSVAVAGQVPTSTFSDTSGNTWTGSANCFAVGAVVAVQSGNLQTFNGTGITGGSEPSPWQSAVGATTPDNTVTWTCLGPHQWQANHAYAVGDVVMGFVQNPAGTPSQLYYCTTAGVSGANEPGWTAGIGLLQGDAGVVWTCQGRALVWADIGPNTNVTNVNKVVDTNGYLETVMRSGKSGGGPPWPTVGTPEIGQLTTDGTAIWVNSGPFSPAGTAPVQYGYAWENPLTKDITNMSPASIAVTVSAGAHIVVQGDGPPDPDYSLVILYRTAQGGSTFLFDASFPSPAAGTQWTYNDNTPDSGLNPEIQALVNGEGTPLPAGASCLEYHVGRIWVGVGNVVMASSGPDAVIAGSSGMAGFNVTFTAQAKVMRLWANSLGLLVYTVRDVYMIAPDPNTGVLNMTRWIENMPLLNYDAWAVNYTTPMMLTGKRMVMAFDPSAGILEPSFPIADLVKQFNPATSYVTYHSESSSDTALYVSDGATGWYRMAPTAAPDNGAPWSPFAAISGGMSAVQSVEVTPGSYKLLLGPPAAGGPIMQRDTTVNTDNGVLYAADGEFGTVVLAQPSYMAALAWMTLEAEIAGNAPALSVLLGELAGTFENVPRTRQDPTDLPPSTSLYSNRHSLLQNQKPVWCRHLRYTISWPAEDAANELLTTTIYGQMWQEQRSQ